MDDRWTRAGEFWERLRWARSQTNFERAKDAADSLNIKPGTYRTYERSAADSGRIPPLTEIQRIARKFKVSWSWLASGDGSPDDQFLVVDERLAAFGERVAQVPGEKQADAINAAMAVLESFIRRAG